MIPGISGGSHPPEEAQMTTVSAMVTLFLVMDPLGNIPYFLSALKPVPVKRHPKIMFRELTIALIVLFCFMFLGQHFLELLHLKQESISIAGGIILFLIAIRMIFPTKKSPEADQLDGEPFIVPLAIPGVAGPSSLATVLLLVKSEPDRLLDWAAALSGAWLMTSIILMASPLCFKLLKKRGLIAMERLMGMILVALSVQMFLDGIGTYLHIR